MSLKDQFGKDILLTGWGHSKFGKLTDHTLESLSVQVAGEAIRDGRQYTPVVETLYQSCPSAALSRATMRAQRGSSATERGNALCLALCLGVSFAKMVIVVISEHPGPTVHLIDVRDTPILAFKSDVSHPISAMDAPRPSASAKKSEIAKKTASGPGPGQRGPHNHVQASRWVLPMTGRAARRLGMIGIRQP